jgi:hypothetical protein
MGMAKIARLTLRGLESAAGSDDIGPLANIMAELRESRRKGTDRWPGFGRDVLTAARPLGA